MKLMIPIASLCILLLAACSTPPAPPVPTPVPTATQVVPTCDVSLWHHVYHPSRLQVVDVCRTITGTITDVRHEADGDAHILLRLDDGTTLVTEAICVYPVSQADAVAACQDFTPGLVIPPVGDHVAITGTYVLDTV